MKKNVLLISLLFIFKLGFAQCNFGFSYTVSWKTLTVNDTSATSNHTKITWDWGDGNSFPNAKTKTYTYNKSGIYNVTMKVYDSTTTCGWITYQQVISIGYPNLKPSFNYAVDNAHFFVKNYIYTFTSNSTGQLSACKYYWDLGDSTTDTGMVCKHKYAHPGSKDIRLIVVDTSNSNTDTAWGTFEVKYFDMLGISNESDSRMLFHRTDCIFWDSLSYANTVIKWSLLDSTYEYSRYSLHERNFSHDFKGSTGTETAPSAVSHELYDTYRSVYGSKFYSNFDFIPTAYFQDSVAGLKVYFKNYSDTGLWNGEGTWDFGDGNTYNGKYPPSHTYPARGAYEVTYSFFDSLNWKNLDYKRTILADSSWPCNLTWQVLGSIQGLNGRFGDTSEHVTGTRFKCISNSAWNFSHHNAHYTIDFGDGTTEDLGSCPFTIHPYYEKKEYTTKIIMSSDHCQDTVEQKVNLSPPAPSNKYKLSGNIWCGSNKADYYKVWLITYDSTLGKLTAVDSQNINQNNYTFTFYPIKNKYYMVKANLRPYTNYQALYLPTYLDNKITWDSAALIYQNKDTSIDIHMRPGINPGGPGFISGFTSQGANKTDGVGDPVANITIMVFNSQGISVAYAVTGDDGLFQLPSLPYDHYTVYADYPGKTCFKTSITLSASQPFITGIKAEVNSNYISFFSQNNSVNPIAVSTLNIFPNPSDGIYTFNISNESKLEVWDASGRLIVSKQVAPQNGYRLDLRNYPSGNYWLKIRQGEEVQVVKLMKN